MASERPRWREDFPVRGTRTLHDAPRAGKFYARLGLLAERQRADRVHRPDAPLPPRRQPNRAATRSAPGGSLLFSYPTTMTSAFWCATRRRLAAFSHGSARISRARSCTGRASTTLACPCHKGSFFRQRRPSAGRAAHPLVARGSVVEQRSAAMSWPHGIEV
jgi:hypothetical protein